MPWLDHILMRDPMSMLDSMSKLDSMSRLDTISMLTLNTGMINVKKVISGRYK